MVKYVNFSATVTWFNVKEAPEVKRPLTGLYYEVIYRRGNKDKKIGDGYLNDEGCFTISREETKKLPFDSKTYFETHIYSKTEECDVFWRKRKTGHFCIKFFNIDKVAFANFVLFSSCKNYSVHFISSF